MCCKMTIRVHRWCPSGGERRRGVCLESSKQRGLRPCRPIPAKPTKPTNSFGHQTFPVCSINKVVCFPGDVLENKQNNKQASSSHSAAVFRTLFYSSNPKRAPTYAAFASPALLLLLRFMYPAPRASSALQ